MYTKVTSLTDHLLQEHKTSKTFSQGFITIFHQLENAGKIIASHVKASGLVDIIGKTGNMNSFGEEVQKLDEFANTILVDTLLATGEVHAVVSEELPEPIFAPKNHAGDYIVYFDPLDGSSNIDTNCPIGTIFAIYHKKDGLLQPGKNQVAAGYILYGSSVLFVFTTGSGVNGFTLDPAIGSFLLSHPQITIPQEGPYYSINEGYKHDEAITTYLAKIKQSNKAQSRYVGSLVADAHRTFIKGGIFLAPPYLKQPKGKLRLMIEVNPFAFLTEQAGGKTIGRNNMSPLETVPTHIHERSEFIMGSPKNINEYLKESKN
jgi:fructose-1,6-bisphosphatase I